MSTALVLSGGGAKGSFEVGALQYLYENGFLATVICSTSVGSVNAIQLAHGGTVATQKATFDRLKTIWQTEMTFNEDMYVEAAWLQSVSPRTRATIVDIYSGNIELPSLLNQVAFFPLYVLGQAAGVGVDLYEGIKGLLTASSVFTLDPIRAKLRKYLDRAAVANSGVQLRLVTVSLDSGAIRYVTQDGHVLETNGMPVPGVNAALCSAERDAYNAAVAARNTAQLDVAQARSQPQENLNLQQALQALKQATADVADARRRLDQCIAAATGSAAAGQLVVDVADGVVASATIPCAFPPVALGDENYVDGGIRWVLPLKAALDSGADAIVAINASPAGVPPAQKSYRNADLIDIANRSVFDILLWETQERHLEAAKDLTLQQRRKTWVVTPHFEVHDTFTIDPGLIDINIGYGWMCAADVTTDFPFTPEAVIVAPHGDGQGSIGTPDTSGGVVISPPRPAPAPAAGQFVAAATDPALALLADAIARCRRKCWEVEHEVFGARIGEMPFSPDRELSAVPSPNAVDSVRLFKTVLGLLVAARQELGGKVPSDATMWADNWERHHWAPSDVPVVGATPWSEFLGVENRPAEARPTSLIVQAPGHAEVWLLTPFKGWITSEAALMQTAPGRGWAAVRQIPIEYIDAFPRGPDINAA